MKVIVVGVMGALTGALLGLLGIYTDQFLFWLILIPVSAIAIAMVNSCK